MPRPKSKTELIIAASEKYEQLIKMMEYMTDWQDKTWQEMSGRKIVSMIDCEYSGRRE